MKKLLLVLAVIVALAVPAFSQQQILKASTAYPLGPVLIVDSSDHIAGKTGCASPTLIKITKGFGAAVTPSGTWTELDSTNFPGSYYLTGNATDTGTDGPIGLEVHCAGADPYTGTVGVVVDFNPRDAVHFGLTGIPNAAAGASGGLLISGSNSGTTTLGALTITGATTHTGNVVLSDGLTISAPSTSNRAGITVTGNGTGAGFSITGGNGATGNALNLIAASTNGNGLSSTGTGTGAGGLLTSGGGATGDALKLVAASTNGNGIQSTGVGTGSGLLATSGGGATGNGITATSAATAGQGFSATGNGTGHGILATSGAGATGDGFKAISAATNGNGFNGVGTGTGADIKGSGLEQLVSKAVASSFSGTVAANSVIGYLADVSATSAYDRTTMSFEAAYSNAPTVAQMATGIWQDSTSGDFTTASSIGKSLYTSGVVPGGTNGLFIAGTNAATTITTALTTTFTGNLSGSAGSIASGGITNASLAADTGLKPILSNTLSSATGTTAVFSAGSPSATNSFYNNDILYITGGTGAGQARFITAYVGATKTATVATWTTTPDNTSTFSILPFDAVAGATAPTVAQIATGVWQDTTAGDFTTASSIGKSLYTSGTVPGAAGGHFIAGTNAATTITTGLTTHFIGTVDTLTTYTGNTVQTGDNYARLGAPAGASISADIAATKALLPTALVGGRMDSSVGAVAANAITAASIASDADTEIENAVLNATTAGHTTAGSIGKAIGDASAAGDPWGTALPGAYSSGTAGYIIGTNIQPVKTVKKGEAFTNVPIWMLSSTGAAVTGLSTSAIACQISIDGGAWNPLADTTETEIGLGKYVVDLSSSETNGNSISLDCSATGAQHYRTNITPQR